MPDELQNLCLSTLDFTTFTLLYFLYANNQHVFPLMISLLIVFLQIFQQDALWVFGCYQDVPGEILSVNLLSNLHVIFFCYFRAFYYTLAGKRRKLETSLCSALITCYRMDELLELLDGWKELLPRGSSWKNVLKNNSSNRDAFCFFIFL